MYIIIIRSEKCDLDNITESLFCLQNCHIHKKETLTEEVINLEQFGVIQLKNVFHRLNFIRAAI